MAGGRRRGGSLALRMYRSGLIALILCMVATSCTRQRHVSLVELRDAHSANTERTERIYLDRYGDLYPGADVPVLYANFFDPWNKETTTSGDAYAGSLDFYFTGRYTAKGGEKKVDGKSTRTARVDALRTAYDLPGDMADSVVFDRTQDLIRSGTVDRLRSGLDRSANKELVVLVHGFNDANPSGDFVRLRAVVDAFRGQHKPVYLEVYWDGLTANQGAPQASRIWGRAQRNSAYVGLSLRRILRMLPSDTRIRFVTHSLGASVATVALFNCECKWPKCGKEMPDYLSTLGVLHAPEQADIRVGMIAPAIPGVATFSDFNQRGWPMDVPTNNISRVVVGYNWNDYAVTKRVFGTDILGKSLGSTSLGADAETKGNGEVARTRQQLIDLGYGGQIDRMYRTIPFNSYGRRKASEPHGLYYYMQREPMFTEFIKAVFDEP